MEEIRFAFISYLDENNKKVEGMFEIVQMNQNFVIVRTKKNLITLPISRILKIKEGLDNG